MPRTTTTRNTLPVPYIISPLPASQLPNRHDDRHKTVALHTSRRSVNAQASSSSSTSSNSQIWRSIESIILAQRTAIEAQAQKLAVISSSIEKRLHRIHESQNRNASAIGKELEELKALVGQKRDEGYRLGGMEWEKMMEIGWIADRGTGIGVDRAIRNGVGSGVMISGGTQEQEQEGEMRFEEFIDMSQFEESSRPGSQNNVPHDQDQDQDRGDGELASTPLSFAPSGSANSDILNIGPDLTVDESRHSAPRPENAVAGSSTFRIQDNTRPRAGSEISLSSGIESLPETDTERSRAGSDITDILTGINTYLARPGRARPLSISTSKSPVPPPPPEHRLRKRTKRPIYSSKWHPMDSTRKQLRLEDEAQKAADEANEEERSVRGLSTAPRTFLEKSDGQVKEGRKEWWKWGENSLVGRMQDIACDLCRGRAHWACAGLSQYDDMTQESWFCPDCYPTLDDDSNATPQHIPEVQQERCIRPDCILRSKRAVNKKKGDESRHVVERIIGRRVLSRRVNGSKRYEYLCKWDGWEYYESTWQEPSSFDDGVTHPENQFLAQCAKEGINSQARVVLLKEAEEFWDENGDLKVDLLEELGIAEAEWWPSPKGKYKVLIA